MLDELEWPSLEARRDQSSLLLFHKINCGAMSIEKDKYMTPAHSLKTTRSSHSAQYRRHQTYSDVFLFFILSKLALPGVMLKFERSQYVRKKERNKDSESRDTGPYL